MAQNNNKHQRKRRRTTTRKYQTNKQRKQNTNGRHCDDKMADACVPRRRWKWSAGFLFFFHSTADVPRRSFFFSLFSFFLLFGWSFFIFTFKLISFRFFSWPLFLSILSFFWSFVSLDSSGCYRVLPSFFFYKSLILASFLGVPDRFSVMLQVFYGFQWTWLVFNGFYLVSWSFTGCFHGSLWVLLGFT